MRSSCDMSLVRGDRPFVGRQAGDLVGPDAERLQHMRTERVYQRNVGSIAAARDHDATNARHIVAWVEGAPGAVEEDLDPRREIHGIDHRHADIAEMAVDVARRDVEAAAE